MLIRFAKDPVQEETNLDELADYFGDEDEEGDPTRREENPAGKIMFRARAIKARPRTGGAAVGTSAEVDEDEDGAELSNNAGEYNRDRPETEGTEKSTKDEKNNDKSSSSNSDTPERGAATMPQRMLHSGLPLADVRAVPLAPTKRRVAFTPAINGDLVIEFQDSGTDTNYALNVISATVGIVNLGRVTEVTAQAGVRVILEIEFAKPFDGTLRVVANAV